MRARREELGMGQSQACPTFRGHPADNLQWESGEIVPPPKRLTKLAQALALDSNRMLSYAGYLDPEADGRQWDRPRPL
ncbi:hypothetical protein BH23ACT12_BH23ACT12_19210 [soil metagenome]